MSDSFFGKASDKYTNMICDASMGVSSLLYAAGETVPKHVMASGLRGESISSYVDELSNVEIPEAGPFDRAELAENMLDELHGGKGSRSEWVNTMTEHMKDSLGARFGMVDDVSLDSCRQALKVGLLPDEYDAGLHGQDMETRLRNVNSDMVEIDGLLDALVDVRMGELASAHNITVPVYSRANREFFSKSMGNAFNSFSSNSVEDASSNAWYREVGHGMNHVSQQAQFSGSGSDSGSDSNSGSGSNSSSSSSSGGGHAVSLNDLMALVAQGADAAANAAVAALDGVMGTSEGSAQFGHDLSLGMG